MNNIENATIGTCEVDSRMTRHIDMHEAIGSLDSLLGSAQSLLDQITEKPRPCDPCCESEPPSLEDVLIHGPDRIRKLCAETHEVLKQIHETLF